MKVLMISTDAKILEESSLVRERMKEYGELCDELHIIIFTNQINPSTSLGGLTAKLEKNVWVYPTNSRKRIMALWDGAKLALPLLRVWHSEKARVLVTSQDGFAHVLAVPLAKLFGAGLEVQIHTDVFSPYFARTFILKLHQISYRVALRFATVVRVVSERVKQSLLVRRVPAWKMRVIPVFIQTRRGQEKGTNEKSLIRSIHPKWQHILVWVGRMNSEKNPLLALAVLARVLQRFPQTGLIFVGDGPLRSALESEVTRLGLENHVAFVGWQQDVALYLEAADIYLATSDFEGYGVSLVEAALAGVPIVSTDVGLVGELLNEHNVLSAPVRDGDKLTEQVFFLLQNEGARSMMRERLALVWSELPEKAKLLARIKEAWTWAARPVIVDRVAQGAMLVKYIISGGSAAVVDIGALFIMTHFVGLHYLVSAGIAFLIAFWVSFFLQKYWTFQDKAANVHSQAGIYFVIAIVNLCINQGLMYLWVDVVGIYYVFAQVITGALIAFSSFFVYRKFVFKKK